MEPGEIKRIVELLKEALEQAGQKPETITLLHADGTMELETDNRKDTDIN